MKQFTKIRVSRELGTYNVATWEAISSILRTEPHMVLAIGPLLKHETPSQSRHQDLFGCLLLFSSYSGSWLTMTAVLRSTPTLILLTLNVSHVTQPAPAHTTWSELSQCDINI